MPLVSKPDVAGKCRALSQCQSLACGVWWWGLADWPGSVPIAWLALGPKDPSPGGCHHRCKVASKVPKNFRAPYAHGPPLGSMGAPF